MKRNLTTVVSLFVFSALLDGPAAAAPTPAAHQSALTMSFLVSPAVAVGGYASYPHVVQVRSNDMANVFVHQPIACGERLGGASFELEGEFLLLRYAAPYLSTWDSSCISTGMFVFHGLPTGELQIVALPEPMPVTSTNAATQVWSWTMSFLASPTATVGGYAANPDVMSIRSNDATNVNVHQPVTCGERLRHNSFELEGEFLLLRYCAFMR